MIDLWTSDVAKLYGENPRMLRQGGLIEGTQIQSL